MMVNGDARDTRELHIPPTTTELPPYRAMLAVDVKDFSRRPGRYHHRMTERIPDILGAAFNRAGLGREWAKGRRFPRSDGDGYIAGFRPRVLPFLLSPLLAALETELAALTSDATLVPPVRMRVSVAVGPVTDTGGGTIAGGSGTDRVVLHRLLDSTLVRQLLERSGPGTHVAAIVSRRAFEDAVLTGYTAEDGGYYVPAPVAEKSYEGEAYLRVPNPTGGLLREGFLPDAAAAPSEPRARAGELPQERSRTVIGVSRGPTHTGDGDMYFRGSIIDEGGRRRDHH